MEKQKKIYYGIDYCKLICAILIVFMHSFRGESEYVTWGRDVLTTISVPYFFIVSGFFFAKGIGGDNSLMYTKKYFKRIFVLYTAWSILTIPVSLLCIDMHYPESSVLFRLTYLIRMYFLSGSCGIYWYILALLVNCWILYYTYTGKIPLWIVWIIAIAFFVIGVLYESGHYGELLFFESIHIIFGSSRNFIHTGLIYMLIGYTFAFHQKMINIKVSILLFLILLFVRSWECKHSDFQFVQMLLAVALFMISAQVNVGNSNTSLLSRKYSMALYLEHFPLLILIDYFYRIQSFWIVFPMMLIICTLLYLALCKWLPAPIYKVFYAENK